MCTLLLEKNLLPLREFPSSITVYPREYVKITRPEDIEEYDYIASLNGNSIIDFTQFRAVSSDLSWIGINYLLPIAQRCYLYQRREVLIDFFEDFIWLLGYQDGIKKLVELMSFDDINLLKNWLSILLENKDLEPDYVEYYSSEIKNYIFYLEQYLISEISTVQNDNSKNKPIV